jgi:ubiquinol-cytochrome c reductase cytochrome b subunit
VALGGLVSWRLMFPWVLGDPENFIPANSSVTPQHIQPEWYFLFAYAILRRIPNKLGGVIALLAAILIFLILPWTYQPKFPGIVYYPLRKLYYWSFIVRVILLTWVGARPVSPPYIEVGQALGLFYFSFFFLNPLLFWGWDEAFINRRTKPLR